MPAARALDRMHRRARCGRNAVHHEQVREGHGNPGCFERLLASTHLQEKTQNEVQLAPVGALVCCTAASIAFAQVDTTDQSALDLRLLTPKERLGRQLFFDTDRSQLAGQSCGSCHDPVVAITDPDKLSPTSDGVFPGMLGNRNTPSAMYAAFSPVFHFDEAEGVYVGGQFWDGRAATLEEQATGPFLNPVEMANTNRQAVIDEIRNAPYAPLFKHVFGQDAFADTDSAYERMSGAIAAFGRTRGFNRFT